LSQPKSTNPDQQSFLNPNVLDQLNPKHPLLQLASRIKLTIDLLDQPILPNLKVVR
jgi:hypothetical protein